MLFFFLFIPFLLMHIDIKFHHYAHGLFCCCLLHSTRGRLGRFLEFTDFQLNNAVLGGFNEFLLKQSIKEGLAKAGSFKEASS